MNRQTDKQTDRMDERKMEEVLDSDFRIDDAEARDIMARLKLDNVHYSRAPGVSQELLSGDGLKKLFSSFPASQGWVLYTDGLVNFMKRSAGDDSREILELELCAAADGEGYCRTLRAVLIAEDLYSVTQVDPAGAGDSDWVYAYADTAVLVKNSFRSTLDGEGLARYRVWYRCFRSGAVNNAVMGRWVPWMQQFAGFIR